MKPEKTAYSYIRFSTPDQALGGSEDRQLEEAKAYCKQQGLRLSEKTFADRGISAFHGKHRKKGNTKNPDGLKALLELVKPGEVILIEDIDRWSRENAFESVNEIRTVVKRGVEIHFTKQRVVVNTETLEMDHVEWLLFSGGKRANGESKRKCELIQADWDKKRALARSGKPVRINRLPCWLKWDVEASKPVVIEAKAQIVRHVFELARAGNRTLEIVRKLRQEKVPSVSSQKGAEWNTVLVRRLLTNKATLGFYVQSDPPVANVWPAIVDEDLYHGVQGRQNIHPPDKRPGGKRESETNLFTGIARCGCCNRYNLNAHIGGKSGTPKLICQAGHRGSTDCRHFSVPIALVENSCLSFLASADLIRPLLVAGQPKPSKVLELQGRLADAEKQVTKLTSLIMGDSEPSPTLYARLKLEEAKTKTLRLQIDEEQARERAERPASIAYGEFVSNLPALKANVARRPDLRKAIAQVVEKLVLDPRPVTKPDKNKPHLIKSWAYQLYLRGASGVPINFTICKNGDWASDLIAKLDYVETQKEMAAA